MEMNGINKVNEWSWITVKYIIVKIEIYEFNSYSGIIRLEVYSPSSIPDETSSIIYSFNEESFSKVLKGPEYSILPIRLTPSVNNI